MRPDQSQITPRLDRAMDALEDAAIAAEQAVAGVAPPAATLDDFLAAAKLDPLAVRARLDRVMMGQDPELGLDRLLEAGVLAAIFPEVHAMVGFGDGEWRHKDVWKHTKQVVRQAVPRLEVRWASLFHDIGKVKTRSITADGKVHFLGHAEVGTRMFDKLDRRVQMFAPEPALRETVRFLVLHHLRANQYEKGWTDSAVRRFARELGEHLDNLLCLARADITTKRPEKKRRGLLQIDELQLRITQLASEDAKVPPLPTGVGDAIMKAFALPPSRLVGDIKRALEEAVAKGEIAPQQPNEAYVEFVAANRARFGLSRADDARIIGVVESPIFQFNSARPAIVDEVTSRVVDAVKDPALVLNDAAFQEIRRLSTGGGGGDLGEWRALARSIGRMSAGEARGKLRDLVQGYAWDVAGNFDPRVYKFASRAAAPLIGALLSPRATARNLPHVFELSALDGRVLVQGPTRHIRRLAGLGTIVFVPTHLSNLDSVVFGFAIERSGLPPATYGAGKNLFSNPVLSYFMHNLGAYRVDRRLKHGLYKDVLKTYSCVLIERGYHSLFFPGGTRSRSGGVERRLKLGLAGTGIEAFARTAERGALRPVFFVPATINYLITLEAETLVDDFLQEEGKARYIIEDDESTQWKRVGAFLNKALGLDAACVIRFSHPLDCFGNEVDEDGVSHDAHGRRVDPATYVAGKDGKPTVDAARDAQYTRELGEAIVASFKKDTVAMATHLVASAAFARMQKTVGGRTDVFSMLRHKDDVLVARRDLAADVEALRDRARALEEKGQIVLSAQVARASGDAIVSDALRAFAGYHTTAVLEPRGADLVLEDTRLVFYYQNRLAAHGLAADLIAPRAARG